MKKIEKVEQKLCQFIENALENGYSLKREVILDQEEGCCCAIGASLVDNTPDIGLYREAEKRLGVTTIELQGIISGFDGHAENFYINDGFLKYYKRYYDLGKKIYNHYCCIEDNLDKPV